MHIVGEKNRDEFVSDPQEAVRRGAQLDSMMNLANIPRRKGVRRMTHAEMNDEDYARSVQMAKILNNQD